MEVPPQILTCNDHFSVQVPFDCHGWIADWFDASLEVNLSAFNLIDVTQWDNELWWWIDAVFFHRGHVGFGTFHMTQVDDLGFERGSKEINTLVKRLGKIL